MKKLLIIFLFFSFVCRSQQYGSTKIGFINIIHEAPDHNKHYWGSSAINGYIISTLYYKTNKKWLSVFLGTLITNAVTIGGKEYLNDKYLKRGVFSYDDIAADLTGSLNCTFVLSMSLINNPRMTKKQIDKSQYENL